MAKRKTHFEQVSLEVLQVAVRQEAVDAPLGRAVCAICGDSVDLIHCKTDEDGGAVHEACYLLKMSSARTA